MQTQKPPRDILTACQIAGIQPDTLLKWRMTPTTVILINNLGQKFTVVQAELPAGDETPQPTVTTPADDTPPDTLPDITAASEDPVGTTGGRPDTLPDITAASEDPVGTTGGRPDTLPDITSKPKPATQKPTRRAKSPTTARKS